MKNLTYLIMAIIMCCLGILYFPWYIVLIVSALFGLLRGNKKYRNAFLQGFLSVLFTYIILYLVRDIPNGHQLSDEVAGVFLLPDGYILFLAGAVIFGLLGGFSWWTGAAIRRLF